MSIAALVNRHSRRQPNTDTGLFGQRELSRRLVAVMFTSQELHVITALFEDVRFPIHDSNDTPIDD